MYTSYACVHVRTALKFRNQTMSYQFYNLKFDIYNHMRSKIEPPHDKTNKMTVRQVKTQISLDICPVWSESLLSAWGKLGSLTTQWVHREDWSDWADAQADLCLHRAHMPLCWFCYEAARLLSFGINYFLLLFSDYLEHLWNHLQYRYSISVLNN